MRTGLLDRKQLRNCSLEIRIIEDGTGAVLILKRFVTNAGFGAGMD
jgi:hypothetical protein